MSLQTQWMRNTEERMIVVGKDEEGFFCVELVNHPSPSGCERWMPTYSDNRRWVDEATARSEFDKLLTAIDTAMNEKFGELAGEIPKMKTTD